MDTKEAIKFIREEDYMFCDNLSMEEIYDYSDKLKEVVDILELLEKYKKMWFELCDVFNHSSGKELMHMNSEDFRNHINRIRDKYLEC